MKTRRTLTKRLVSLALALLMALALIPALPQQTVQAEGVKKAATPKVVSGGYYYETDRENESFSLALRDDGTVWAWGSNYFGQLGQGYPEDRSDILTPVQVKGPKGLGFLTDIIDIAAGNSFAMALKKDGTVWTWGGNVKGTLGAHLGDGGHVRYPVQVMQAVADVHGYDSPLSGVVAIAAGGTHAVALTKDGYVKCWGDNRRGQVWGIKEENYFDYAYGTDVTKAKAIAAGEMHSLAVTEDGRVWGWGWNRNFSLGNKFFGKVTPRPMSKLTGEDLTGVIAVAAGRQHSIALKSDGTVWAWGNNNYGQLGDNSTKERGKPVQVKSVDGKGNLLNVTSISVGACGDHTLALTKDGKVYAWGRNDQYQLGDNSSTDRKTPVQVRYANSAATVSNVTSISAGYLHSMYMDGTGKVYAWGNNENGQLGEKTKTARNGAYTVAGPIHWFYLISYPLTVVNGTGSGNYYPDTAVAVKANAPSAGKVFDKWTSTGSVTVDNANNATTKLTMAYPSVTVNATYKDAVTEPPSTVFLNGNGGTGGTASVSVKYGSAMPSATMPTRMGYNFTGYFDGDKQYYTAAGSSARNWDQTMSTTLFARWTVNKYAVTVTNGTGGGSCTYESTVSITANSPPSGKEFDKWTTSDGVTFADANKANTTFKMPAKAVTVKANYKDLPPSAYAITVTSDGNGTATASPASAKSGDTVTLTATPNAGYKFKEWQTVSGGVTVKDNKFTMPGNAVTVKAIFELIPYTATVTNGTGGGSFTAGQSVSVTANAAPAGKTFDKWTTGDGVSFANAGNSATSFTMPGKNVTVTATYKDLPPSVFAVSVTNDGNGTAKASITSAKKGDTVILTASPDAGYKFKEWKVESGGVSVSDNKFTMPDKDVTIKAVFEKIPAYTITVKDGKADKATAMAGERVVVTANIAPAGKTFDKWTASGDVTLTDANAMSTTFTMPAKNVTVTAVYKDLPPSTYAVSVINDGNGKANSDVSSAKAGDTVTLTAKPNAGYLFKDWFVVSGGVSIEGSKFTMHAEPVIIEAMFEPLPVYAVTVTNGTADKTSATVGQTVTITADKAPDGMKFVRWVPGPGLFIKDRFSMSASFYMPSKDVFVTAEYEELPEGMHTVTAGSDTGGTVRSDPAATPGDTVTLTPEAQPGYKFVGWQVKDGEIAVDDDGTFVMPEGGVDVEAIFEPIPAAGADNSLNAFLAAWWWLVILVFALSTAATFFISKYAPKPGKNKDKTQAAE